MATIYSLFPTPISVNHVDIGEEAAAFVASLPTQQNRGNATSLDRRILHNGWLAPLRKQILAALQEYVETVYKPKNPMDFYITQSWANYTQGGGYHHLHRHNNSIVSGVVYFDAGRNYDAIQFYNPKETDFVIDTDEQIPFNNAGYRIPVGKGDLVLFPSWLWHSVEQLPSDRQGARISVAFNTFAHGVFGDDINLTELKL